MKEACMPENHIHFFFILSRFLFNVLYQKYTPFNAVDVHDAAFCLITYISKDFKQSYNALLSFVLTMYSIVYKDISTNLGLNVRS